jgi:hypothetical protein
LDAVGAVGFRDDRRGAGDVHFFEGYAVKGWAVGAGLLIVVLIGGACKAVITFVGPDALEPYFAGVGAGAVLVLVGLPFAIKLARIGSNSGTQFWMWWCVGLILRLVLLLSFAFGLAFVYRNHPAVALLPMTGVYVTGMFAEMGWVARVLFKRTPTKV